MKPNHQTSHIIMPIVFLIGILFSAHPLIAASNINLSGTMPAFGGITNFRTSPNGRYAVYRADQDTDGVIELYSVLSEGGNPVRLNPLLPTGRKVDRSRSVRTVPGCSTGPNRTTWVSLNYTVSPSGDQRQPGSS
jgi:hypothetical protein